jgi:hypothetical protein
MAGREIIVPIPYNTDKVPHLLCSWFTVLWLQIFNVRFISEELSQLQISKHVQNADVNIKLA